MLEHRYSLIESLSMSSDKTKRMGTVLYISATLLMRETMETIVPVQGIMVLLLLRYVDVSTNSLASGWSEDDYHMAIGYTILDFVVELFVFVSTVLILRNISDEIKPLRIILGEIHMHSLLFFVLRQITPPSRPVLPYLSCEICNRIWGFLQRWSSAAW